MRMLCADGAMGSTLTWAASQIDCVVARFHVAPHLRARGPGQVRRAPDLGVTLSDRVGHPKPAESPAFFIAPEVPDLASMLRASPPLRTLRDGGRAVDVRWRSDRPGNAAARLLLHRGPARSAVILVHGYLGGSYVVEERLWQVRRLYELGLDVALLTLPFHGIRLSGDGDEASHKSTPSFPCADARQTIEGVRQAVFEVRSLIGGLHARGTQNVGAAGMSLGGYIVALVATLEPRLGFAMPVVPLSDLTDFARGRLPDPATSAAALAESPEHAVAHRMVSPLARPSAIAAGRIIVAGAKGDRIAPLSHARELADHFDAPLEIMPGGHLLQLGRSQVQRGLVLLSTIGESEV